MDLGWEEFPAEDDIDMLSTLFVQLYERHAYVNVQVAHRLNLIGQLDDQVRDLHQEQRISFADVEESRSSCAKDTDACDLVQSNFDECKRNFQIVDILENTRISFSQRIRELSAYTPPAKYAEMLGTASEISIRCVRQINALITQQFLRISKFEDMLVVHNESSSARAVLRSACAQSVREQVALSERVIETLSRSRDELNCDLNSYLKTRKDNLDKAEAEGERAVRQNIDHVERIGQIINFDVGDETDEYLDSLLQEEEENYNRLS